MRVVLPILYNRLKQQRFSLVMVAYLWIDTGVIFQLADTKRYLKQAHSFLHKVCEIVNQIVTGCYQVFFLRFSFILNSVVQFLQASVSRIFGSVSSDFTAKMLSQQFGIQEIMEVILYEKKQNAYLSRKVINLQKTSAESHSIRQTALNISFYTFLLAFSNDKYFPIDFGSAERTHYPLQYSETSLESDSLMVWSALGQFFITYFLSQILLIYSNPGQQQEGEMKKRSQERWVGPTATKRRQRESLETKRLSACQILGIIINKQVKAMQKSESEPSIEHAEDLGDQIRSIGSWSFNQNLLYVIFLQKNKLIMVSKKKRRNLRIFDQMADFISTRNSLQCRSHHQKLLQKFGEIKNIISNFKKYITKEQYKQKFQQIFSKDKNKQESEEKTYDVKQEPLSQELNQPISSSAQQPLEKQNSQIPLIVQPKFSEFQLVYNQFLAQFNRQLLEYPLLAYCYPPLLNIS